MKRPFLLMGITAAAYVVFSYVSTGFYQHDEAAHFLNMRGFWSDPSSILSNWAKPGYKLLFAPFSLLGTQAMVVVNAIVAAATCVVAYRLAEAVGSQRPYLAFLFMACQPLWIHLSVRNYSEPVTALIVSGAVLAHYRQGFVVAALLLSYATTIRQELYPLLMLYGLWLLWMRHWRPAMALSVFPILQNMAGWMSTGDPLYLIHSTFGFSAHLQDAYLRQGFLHYFKMGIPMFGAPLVTFLVAYLAQRILYKQPVHHFIVLPVMVFFSMHVLFNVQSLQMGPSTSGNLRYLLVISPLLAVLSALAAEHLLSLRSHKERWRIFYVLLPFAMIVMVYLTYTHNFVMFGWKRDFVSYFLVMCCLAMLIPTLKPSQFSAALVGILLLSVVWVVRPYPPSREDLIVKQVVDWLKENDIEQHPLLLSHTLVPYYLGKAPHEFENGMGGITEETVANADIGTRILWDSHYSYRPELNPNSLSRSYFLEQPKRFRMIAIPADTTFKLFDMMMFEKMRE